MTRLQWLCVAALCLALVCFGLGLVAATGDQRWGYVSAGVAGMLAIGIWRAEE